MKLLLHCENSLRSEMYLELSILPRGLFEDSSLLLILEIKLSDIFFQKYIII